MHQYMVFQNINKLELFIINIIFINSFLYIYINSRYLPRASILSEHHIILQRKAAVMI